MAYLFGPEERRTGEDARRRSACLMVPPPSKKVKFCSEEESKLLQKTVRQALLSDNASCKALLVKLVGLEKEIVDALVDILKSCIVFQFSPTSPVLHVVYQYFASIGVGTAIERFHEFHDLILSNIANEYASNFAFLVEKLITFAHVLRHDKLRHEICSHLPDTIKLLWKNKKRVEACRIAKLFVQLLMVAKRYHDEENLSKLWLEKTYSEEMMKCPYMSALTVLLDPGRTGRAEMMIELSSLLELPSNEVKELCLRSQAADLFLTFLSSYATYCSRKQLEALLEFLILEYKRTDNISSFVRDINHATDCLADIDILWEVISEILYRHLSEVLSKEDSGKKSITNSLANALQCLSTIKESSESSFEAPPAPLRSFFEQERKWKRSRKLDLSPDSKCVIGVLCDLPLHALHSSSALRYSVAVLMFAITLEPSDLALFSTSIRVLQSLAGQTEVRQLLKQMFITDGIFAHHWFISREAEYSPALCKGVIKFLCDILEADCNTKIRSESMCDLCPALKYFEGREVTCWSWEQVMRLSVLFTTTKWEELLRCSECLQQDVIEKIKTTYLVSMLSDISWKDQDRAKAYADRWSILFTCWEAIPRGVRQSVMTRLLGNDLNVIRKFADHVIRGKLQLDSAIVDQAVTFRLKYLIALDGAQTLESIADWKVLLYLQKINASVDIVISLLSVEKILEMFQSCSMEETPDEDALAIVERMLLPRLKERSTEVISYLTSIFENAKVCSQLLGCAAAALKVFAQTDIERDVVVLCLSLLSVHDVTGADFHKLRDMQTVLYSAIQYSHSATNNDQCAVFAQLFVKMLQAVQHFIYHRCGTADEIDALVHGANRLSQILAQHKLYYSRVVASILSQVIDRYDSSQVAIFKLHSINDAHSSSMMATSLPPAQRLQYKRIFKALKAMKPVV